MASRLAVLAAFGVLGATMLASLGGVAPGPEERVLAGPSRPTAAAVPVAATTPASVEPTPPAAVPVAAPAPALPPDSGGGRRIVFDLSDQRVWLVDDADAVARTYLVSGSRYDQLALGTYEVYSRSETTTSWTGAETMRFMVRFARGARAAIGFHDIPLAKGTGQPVQTPDQLGQPLSDGCVRQAPADAEALWHFAPVGTTVVVTA